MLRAGPRPCVACFGAKERASTCPPEAAARLEAWLLSTRGAELRKAKSLDTALRSMAPVTYVLSLDATQPAVACDPTRRPQATHVLDLRLPDTGFAGHIIGRGGQFIKPLLERSPQVRVHIDCDTVSVIGPLAADVSGNDSVVVTLLGCLIKVDSLGIHLLPGSLNQSSSPSTSRPNIGGQSSKTFRKKKPYAKKRRMTAKTHVHKVHVKHEMYHNIFLPSYCVTLNDSANMPVTGVNDNQRIGNRINTSIGNKRSMARNGLRTRPPAVDPRAADGDRRQIPFASIPHHTLILLARASAPYSLPRPSDGNSRMQAGPMVRATFWSSKLSTPCSHRH